jgi:hypothetical protein
MLVGITRAAHPGSARTRLFRLISTQKGRCATKPPPIAASLLLSSSHVTVSLSISLPPTEINDVSRKSAKNPCWRGHPRTLKKSFSQRYSQQGFRKCLNLFQEKFFHDKKPCNIGDNSS